VSLSRVCFNLANLSISSVPYRVCLAESISPRKLIHSIHSLSCVARISSPSPTPTNYPSLHFSCFQQKEMSMGGPQEAGSETQTTIIDGGNIAVHLNTTTTTSPSTTTTHSTTTTTVTSHPSAPSTSHIAVRDLPTVGQLSVSPSCSATISYDNSSPRLPPTPRYTPSPQRGEELEQEVTTADQPLSDSFPASAGKGKATGAKGKGGRYKRSYYPLSSAFFEVSSFSFVRLK